MVLDSTYSLDEHDTVQPVNAVPAAADVQCNVCCSATEEGAVKVGLDIARCGHAMCVVFAVYGAMVNNGMS